MKLTSNLFFKGLLLGALFVSATFVSAQAAVYTFGHGDIGIGYEDDALDLHFHAEGGMVDGVGSDEEYEPGDVLIIVPNTTLRPPSATLASTFGSSGFWRLPQGESTANAEGAPFLGFGAEELDPDEWDGNITISLAGVVSPSGLGKFGVWDFPDGELDWHLSTNGADNDGLSISPGFHGHYNVGFSEPGIWEITLTASGIREGEITPVTNTATYSFNVIPEPSAALLGALGAFGLLRRRR